MGNQSSSDTEAVKIANALQPFVKSWYKEWNRSCVRSKRMTVTTAPDSSTGLIGVTEGCSDGECMIPYTIQCATANVGDSVICCWNYDNMQTLYAEYLCDFSGNRLKGILFGDSLVFGYTKKNGVATRTDYPFDKTIDALLGTRTKNFGVSGQGWAYSSSTAHGKLAYTTLTEHTTDIESADFIILAWGANDCRAELGSLSDDGDESPVTTLGQVFKCVNYISTINPFARVIIVAPWNCMGNGATHAPNWQYDYLYTGSDNPFKVTRKAINDALGQFCKNYWIPYIDLYDSPFSAFNLPSYMSSDNVHPTDDGYAALGRYLAAKINSIIYADSLVRDIAGSSISNISVTQSSETNEMFIS